MMTKVEMERKMLLKSSVKEGDLSYEEGQQVGQQDGTNCQAGDLFPSFISWLIDFCLF